MAGFASIFGGGAPSGEFDRYDEFVPSSLPDPGGFLGGHDVLERRRHCAFHRLSSRLFARRGVIDATFGYNLACLNLDRRHPESGYRYAVETDEGTLSTPEGRVLRAEFTPTTPFCPQSASLTIGSFRAWNGLADRHEFGLVRVRIAPMHHSADRLNDALRDLEATFVEVGELPDSAPADTIADDGVDEVEPDPTNPRPDAPF